MEEICTLLGYYAALGSSSVPTFRENQSSPIFKGQDIFFDFLTLEDETDMFSRNVGTELPPEERTCQGPKNLLTRLEYTA
jgi:hypothetical protein